MLPNTTPVGSTIVSFGPRESFGAGGFPVTAALGDLNGDGLADIVAGDANPPFRVGVLLNTTDTDVNITTPMAIGTILDDNPPAR